MLNFVPGSDMKVFFTLDYIKFWISDQTTDLQGLFNYQPYPRHPLVGPGKGYHYEGT